MFEVFQYVVRLPTFGQIFVRVNTSPWVSHEDVGEVWSPQSQSETCENDGLILHWQGRSSPRSGNSGLQRLDLVGIGMRSSAHSTVELFHSMSHYLTPQKHIRNWKGICEQKLNWLSQISKATENITEQGSGKGNFNELLKEKCGTLN